MLDIVLNIFTTTFFYSIFRVTTPILFASLAVVVSDLAGVVNIGVEGLMLFSSFAGVVISAATNNTFLGILGGVLCSVIFSLIMAFFHLNLKTDIILAGIAVNLMASGGTVFALNVFTGQKGISSGLKSKVIPNLSIPILDDIPILGSIFSNHNILTYIAFLLVIVIWYFLYKTPLGLRIRAVGENPNAAKSVGINVPGLQYLALIISGIIAGLGGVYMSMGYVSWFSRDMIAGRGFMGVAAAAMGNNKPGLVLLAALLFGLADALSNYLQSLRIPAEIVQMIPYLTTIVVLTIYSRHTKFKKQVV